MVLVLEPCLELAQPVKHPGKRRSRQETVGNLGSRALKPWGVGIACPALGGQPQQLCTGQSWPVRCLSQTKGPADGCCQYCQANISRW